MTTWFEEKFEQWHRKGMLEGEAKGRAQGQAEAKADSVLRLLAARGVHVDDKSRQRIMSCTDMATLDRWFDQALNATRLSDVLGELAQ